MAKQDLYAVLGVPRGSKEKEIKQAYRRLARQYHPDVNPGDKQAEARFKEINAAHEVLGDSEKRSKYDKYGDQWEHADQIEEMQKQRGGQAFRFGGGTAMYSSHVLQKCLRDINAAAQHQMVSDRAYENHGQFALGFPDANPMG